MLSNWFATCLSQSVDCQKFVSLRERRCKHVFKKPYGYCQKTRFVLRDKLIFNYDVLLLFAFINELSRIVYLARLLQQYIVSASTELQNIRKLPPSRRDRKVLEFRQNSLKMAENTLQLAKVFAHKLPSFEITVQPSWNTENKYVSQFPVVTFLLRVGPPKQF